MMRVFRPPTLEPHHAYSDRELERNAGQSLEDSIDDVLRVTDRVITSVDRFVSFPGESERLQIEQLEAQRRLEEARAAREALAVRPTATGDGLPLVLIVAGGAAVVLLAVALLRK
jgi:hypothetical protein